MGLTGTDLCNVILSILLCMIGITTIMMINFDREIDLWNDIYRTDPALIVSAMLMLDRDLSESTYVTLCSVVCKLCFDDLSFISSSPYIFRT